MPTVAAALNRSCQCVTTDFERLRSAVETPEVAWDALRSERPHLFSSSALFLTPAEIEGMQAIVEAVERVVAAPGWQELTVAGRPASARVDAGPRGVFFGYDFHLGADGPRLIEINTNAGGALVNLALARSQQVCCDEIGRPFEGALPLDRVEDGIVAMFREEWRLARGDAPLRSVAIVDEDPERQFLAPEFRMFRDLFRRHGLEARICGPEALEAREDGLYADGERIDLVYDRLTDFYLEQPASAALRRAFEAGTVVVTPHPRAHALYAHKANLAVLSDPEQLAALGVDPGTAAVLARGVPRTIGVDPARADALWSERRRWFFKPGDGFGSRAAYRGDKLTRGRWAEIVADGRYVAQELVPPSERTVRVDDQPVALKADVRAYVYAGRLQLVAARLYQGQTTNLRTAGGGFAAVFVTPGSTEAPRSGVA